jgi:hypothetical protein
MSMTPSEHQMPTHADGLREEHERLMAEAAHQPGLAEVLEVYGRLAPYAPPPVPVQPVTRYATGGNG